MKASRDVHLLLTLLPQSAACCAAISYLNADERTALDQVAIAVQRAAGDVNAHVRIAEEWAHDAMECVQGLGGGFLWVHLREGLLLKDMGTLIPVPGAFSVARRLPGCSVEPGWQCRVEDCPA
ncbi:hypothetical protein ABT124_42950 [Streptomyces sp. NPDC001982]|uniref:hypothetical protein n=1 Tax=Streptomyces sp. NPDC001982 TaxID=3154405 RepID=UPI00332E0A1C